MELLVLWIVLALVLSHLCSVLEATLISVRISALLERRAAGSRGAARLLDIKRNRIDDAISAILILNTLAITVGATLAGAQAARLFGDEHVGVFSAALTVLLLVRRASTPASRWRSRPAPRTCRAWVLTSMHIDPGVLHSASFAKYAVAFF